jgi:hypothetical protein
MAPLPVLMNVRRVTFKVHLPAVPVWLQLISLVGYQSASSGFNKRSHAKRHEYYHQDSHNRLRDHGIRACHRAARNKHGQFDKTLNRTEESENTEHRGAVHGVLAARFFSSQNAAEHQQYAKRRGNQRRWTFRSRQPISTFAKNAKSHSKSYRDVGHGHQYRWSSMSA